MSDMNPVIRWFHQLGSPPYFDRFAARWAPWGHGLGLLVMAWGVYGALFQVPADYQQGDSFRILYIHVPAAWMSLLVFALTWVRLALRASASRAWDKTGRNEEGPTLMAEAFGPDLKHSRQQGGIQHRDRPLSHQLPLLQAKQTIGMGQGQVEVMDREDHQHT